MSAKDDGKFVRKATSFHNWITADGSSGFKAEPGRYHLYVSYACPWAHRTLLFRKLKGLESVISFSPVDYHMGPKGWSFGKGEDGEKTKDPLYGLEYVRQIYEKAQPDYSARITVPVLWDKKTETIVNNESAEIIRMLNSEFKDYGNPDTPDFYPEDLREEIDKINAVVYDTVNNGVYKCGFAKTQAAYDEAILPLFKSLDMLDERLSTRKYLMGEVCTEADWRLFTTLVRFDPVYVGHFKCNVQRIKDYANLSRYLSDLLKWPGVRETAPPETQFRSHISADGPFLPEPDRYHVYAAYACPFAHRILILRKLKGLESAISLSFVDSVMDAEGWKFGEGEYKDPMNGFHHLHQLYTTSSPDATTKSSVPVLWDNKTSKVVSNDSADLMRILNSEFQNLSDPAAPDFLPAALMGQIEEMNAFIGPKINLGVYKAGFNPTQAGYDAAVKELFEALDNVETILSKQRYLINDKDKTEADWRLFATLVRFDPVYVGHFKCNLRRIVDYPHLYRYLKELYNHPGIKETINFQEMKRGYYASHLYMNPSGIVPAGPIIDL